MDMNTKFWKWPIAVYLFLGGLGGGTIFLSMIFFYMLGTPGELLAWPVFLGVVMLALGCLLLIFELGQPKLFVRAFITKTAIIKWGAVLLSIAMIGALLWWIFFWPAQWQCFWYEWTWLRDFGAIFAAVSSLGLMIYTGILLSSMKARPFWNTPAVPILFTVSALSTGSALLAMSLGGGLDFLFFPRADITFTFAGAYGFAYELCHTIDTILIVAEIIILLLFVVMQYSSSDVTAKAVAKRWLAGNTALIFWGGMIVVGLLCPLLCYLSGITFLTAFLAPVLALAGGVLLRFLFVYNNDRRDIEGTSRYFDRLPSKDAEFLHAAWNKDSFGGY